MGDEADALASQYDWADEIKEDERQSILLEARDRKKITSIVNNTLRAVGFVSKPKRKHYPRPKMVEVECKACHDKFEAREADVKRGWGKFCDKSCKASYQKNGKGAYGKIMAHRYFATHEYNKNKYLKIVNQEWKP